MGGKEKEDVVQESRRTDLVSSGGDRQMGCKDGKRQMKLFTRREEQTQRVVGMTDKCRGQRERGCYSVEGQSRHDYLEGKCTT